MLLANGDRFPETKGRTLEEIGALFGDERIASRWYGMSEEEKEKIAREAVAVVPDSEDEAARIRNAGKSGVMTQERA